MNLLFTPYCADSLPSSSGNTLGVTCRKCRRELIIDASLRLLQHAFTKLRLRRQELQETVNRLASASASRPSSPQNVSSAPTGCLPFRSWKDSALLSRTPPDEDREMRLAASMLMGLDAETIAQYRSLWQTWATELQNSRTAAQQSCNATLSGTAPAGAEDSEDKIKDFFASQTCGPEKTLTFSVGGSSECEKLSAFEHIDTQTSSVLDDDAVAVGSAATVDLPRNFWQSIRAVFASRDSNGVTSPAATSSYSSAPLPLAAVAKKILGHRSEWLPSANAVSCPRCKVWISAATVCFCSLNYECAPCTQSRMKQDFQDSDCAVWDSPVARGQRSRAVRCAKRRRSRSVPVYRDQHCKTYSFDFFNLLHDYSKYETQRELHFNRARSIPGVLDLLTSSKWLSSDGPGLDPSQRYISPQMLQLALTVIPPFIRLLPPTHYVTLFHGLNGVAKDYRKFLDLLLRNHTDLHCFVPDCYSNRAIMGVVSLTEIIRDYLFVDPPQPLGASRIPRTPDLLFHLVGDRSAFNVEYALNSDELSFNAEDEVQDTLIALPRCRYAVGNFPFCVFRTRIFLSFIGHSLGGIIARSVAALDETRLPILSMKRQPSIGMKGVLSQDKRRQLRVLSSTATRDALTTLPESQLSNNFYTPCPTSLNAYRSRSLLASVGLLNFVTFASPHNGIFEDFVGVQAVSYLVPTGRDLITASHELMRLASPTALLPLSRFDVLALYGNVLNDFLVGPLTSLLIDPLPAGSTVSEVPRSFFRRSNDTAGFGTFPLCAKEACASSDSWPVELDAHGFVITPGTMGTDDAPAVVPKCSMRCCIHNADEKRHRKYPLSVGKKSTASMTNTPVVSRKHNRFFQYDSKRKNYLDFVGRLGRDSRGLQTVLKAGLPNLGWATDSSSSLSSAESESGAKSPATDPGDVVRENILRPLGAGKPGNEEQALCFWSEAKASEQKQNGVSVEPMQHLSTATAPHKMPPVHHVRDLSRLHWRRFGVLVRSSFRAHNCIIWHGRLDPGNLGKRIVQHFVDNVFVHAP